MSNGDSEPNSRNKYTVLSNDNRSICPLYLFASVCSHRVTGSIRPSIYFAHGFIRPRTCSPIIYKKLGLDLKGGISPSPLGDGRDHLMAIQVPRCEVVYKS